MIFLRKDVIIEAAVIIIKTKEKFIMKQDMIVILDLGSTENTVIARDIRSLGVYSEIHPHDITPDELKALDNVKGIILNGGENRIVDGKPVGDPVRSFMIWDIL